MLQNILIIANPGSGKGEGPEYAKKLSKTLKKEYKSEIDIRETKNAKDATDWAQQSKVEMYDTVICLGGDGTVNQVVNGLMTLEEPPIFSFIPIGTTNNLGRVLGFDMDPDKALEQFNHLVEDFIDVGQVNHQFFIDVVAIGDIPRAAMETGSDDKSQLGYLAYIVDGAKALKNSERKEYRITKSDGENFQISSNTMACTLISSIGGFEHIIEHRKYNDGLLQFFALKGDVISSGLETLVKEGGVPEGFIDNDKILAFSDNEVSVQLVENQADERMITNVDGDEGPALPLSIKVYRKALKVLRPKHE